MSYIGKTPTAVPLTSSDITDGIITSAKMAFATGKVLQVVSATKVDLANTTSTTFANIPGLSVNITPSSTSNKILLIMSILGTNRSNALMIRFARGGTGISLGTNSGSRTATTIGNFYDGTDTNNSSGEGSHFLDSPSSTSELTYTVQFRMGASGSTSYINGSADDADAGYTARGTSTLTAFEVVG